MNEILTTQKKTPHEIGYKKIWTKNYKNQKNYLQILE